MTMEFFWESSGSIRDGVGFRHFDATHIFWLTVLAVTVSVCSYFYRRCGEGGRKRFRFAVAGLIFADEIAKWIMLLSTGLWTVNYLPFHLCTINIFVIAVHIFKPYKVLDNFLYMICIPAALAALLFPSWTKLPILNFMHMHSSTIHILLALYPIMLTVGGDIKPRASQIPKGLIMLVCMAIPALVVNTLTAGTDLPTNYMFLAEAQAPLTVFEDLFGSHLWGFPILIAAILLVMYLPVELWHYVRKRRKEGKK